RKRLALGNENFSARPLRSRRRRRERAAGVRELIEGAQEACDRPSPRRDGVRSGGCLEGCEHLSDLAPEICGQGGVVGQCAVRFHRYHTIAAPSPGAEDLWNRLNRWLPWKQAGRLALARRPSAATSSGSQTPWTRLRTVISARRSGSSPGTRFP